MEEERTTWAALRRRLVEGPPGRVHAMGLGGVGVAGLAALLRVRGWQVSGCDREAGPLTAWLAAQGIVWREGHDAAHLDDGCELLLRSTAVPADHAEVVRARERGVIVARRGLALAALLTAWRTVAVCGTHGKTTTASFTTLLLRALGDDPGWCIGGVMAALGGVAGAGGGRLMVAEADESDGTLAHYAPAVTVITNIDCDHLEHFSGVEDLERCFHEVAGRTGEGVVYGADDARAAALGAGLPGSIGFGFGAAAALRAVDVEADAGSVRFRVLWQGQSLGAVVLGVTGRHNVLNALAALGAAIRLGHEPERALAALSCLDALPGRRFERVAERDGITVISDYAHHPAEIAALVAAARLQGSRRLLALFQPHRYTRTRALAADFPGAFAGVDERVLAPVYAASEAPLAGGEIEDLYAVFRAAQPEGPAPRLARTLAEGWGWLRRQLRPGDLLLIVGAGDVAQVAAWAARDVQAGRVGRNAWLAEGLTLAEAEAQLSQQPGVRARAEAPLGRLTTLGVGGEAELLAEARHEAALAGLLSWARQRQLRVGVLGAGANTLVSDLGVPGLTVRLGAPGFREFGRLDDGLLEVGCGWNGAALLRRMQAEGWGGLEFLAGVPGQLGGWLAMNAGAHGGEIGARVRRIRGLNFDGQPVIVEGVDAGFGYRRCDALRTMVALRVELRVDAASPAEIGARLRRCRDARLSFAGLRTAGSVFGNPPGGVAAGRLLEEAGCKGLAVGGARVLERHANVIAVAAGGTASDVCALMTLMQRRVQARHGIALEPEVRLPGG